MPTTTAKRTIKHTAKQTAKQTANSTPQQTVKQIVKLRAPKKPAQQNKPVRPSNDQRVSNGHTANGHTANGHTANGHQGLTKPVNAKPSKTKFGKTLPGNQATAPQWLITFLPVKDIDPSPYQPRLLFNAEEMAELVISVRAKGVQQPIIVRTSKARQDKATQEQSIQEQQTPETGQNGVVQDNGITHANNGNGVMKPTLALYELVAGERRLRACKEAGRKHIPAIIRDDLTDAECAELALLENVQRSNLSVIEEARGYKRLMLQFHMKEERIARKVGKSVNTIKETMKLLQLPEAVQKLLAEKKLTASHGHALLPLAPFECVCVLVANKAVKDHLTAASLQSTPLPTAAELRRLGLLAELDWRTKFDWKNTCGSCPFKAYVTSGYNAYCLKPDEWNKKQEAAIEQQKQEAARVLEEARQQNGQAVEAEKLTPGTYRNLSLGSVPAGCSESCPCRSQAADPHDPTKKYPICLDPSRLNELLKAEREANEEARRQQYLALWQEARDVLKNDVEAKNLARLATLIALPVFRAEFCRYVNPEQWQSLTRMVAISVGVFVPWDDLLDVEKADRELYDLLHSHLQAQAQEKLLLLCACLLLAYEANQVVRFGGETPGLDFVLGRAPAEQRELEEAERETSEVEVPEEDGSAIPQEVNDQPVEGDLEAACGDTVTSEGEISEL